jgi:hypothetical protein
MAAYGGRDGTVSKGDGADAAVLGLVRILPASGAVRGAGLPATPGAVQTRAQVVSSHTERGRSHAGAVPTRTPPVSLPGCRDGRTGGTGVVSGGGFPGPPAGAADGDRALPRTAWSPPGGTGAARVGPRGVPDGSGAAARGGPPHGIRRDLVDAVGLPDGESGAARAASRLLGDFRPTVPGSEPS